MQKVLPPLLAACILVLVGCGPKSSPAPSAPSAPAAAPASPTPAPAGAVATLELTAGDTMKFSVTRFEVRPGQRVRVILKNVGSIPKAAMGHNWVLLQRGTNLSTYTNAAVVAAATDYLPPAQADAVIAHTKLLGPKQSDEITFTAPTEPGDYDYLCSFPAHWAAGMKGVLVVK